jgi:hypothetical protein
MYHSLQLSGPVSTVFFCQLSLRSPGSYRPKRQCLTIVIFYNTGPQGSIQENSLLAENFSSSSVWTNFNPKVANICFISGITNNNFGF